MFNWQSYYYNNLELEQLCGNTKAKTVNGERQLQALVDKKKVIITESSIRSDLHPPQLVRCRLINLESAKDAQAKEIVGLKKRIQKLERKKVIKNYRLKRLRKVGESRRVESSEDKDSLDAQEDASNQGRSFEDIDKDAKVSLVDEPMGAKREDDEAKMKMHMEVVQDDEGIAIDAIPLATKPLIIVEYKIVKEGQNGFYHLIRAYGSTNRYSSMIWMLQNISREDLETLWKLLKTKHGNIRPGDDYEKVF
ncbi:hypothetical protein Tco_0060579 [Tanacetum coccineum]